MSKHTKGPWKSGGCAVYQVGGDYIADLVSGVANPNRDPDETEANAHLMAAAPKMLEELKKAQTYILNVSKASISKGDHDYADYDLLDKVETIIAKAEGINNEL